MILTWVVSPGRSSSTCVATCVAVLRAWREGADRVRKGREAAYRFMTAVAGDLPGYQEATRRLFAGTRRDSRRR